MSWKTLIRNVAPTLGAALGGPAGGMAVKFLAEKFLGDAKGSEQELATFIENATPTQMLEIKKADQQFALQMRELDIDVFELEVGDRQNARNLFKVNMWPQIILSALFIVGYFAILAILMYFNDVEINDRVFGILNTVIGVLTAAIPMILQFWFGSSLGSKQKDQKAIRESVK